MIVLWPWRLFSLHGQKLAALVVILLWLWRLIVNMKEISGTFEAALVMAPSIIVKRTEFVILLWL